MAELSEVQKFYIDGHPGEEASAVAEAVGLAESDVLQRRLDVQRRKPDRFARREGIVVMTAAQSTADDDSRKEAGTGASAHPKYHNCIHVIEPSEKVM